jgi:membrane associated rhomboid family serine protease
MIPIRTSVRLDEIPAAVVALIFANVAVFLFQAGLPPDQLEQFVLQNGLVPARYTDPGFARRIGLDPLDFLPFVTNTFMHGGWWHLIVNMWTLWLFGAALEHRLGALRTVALYLACGALASGAHFVTNPGSTVPALGASGGIAGILGAFTLLYPRERIWLLIPVLLYPITFPVRAVIFTALWFLVQVVSGTFELLDGTGDAAGGIAWWAHIGGFLAGFILARFVGVRRITVREIGAPRERVRHIGPMRTGIRRAGAPIRRRNTRRAEALGQAFQDTVSGLKSRRVEQAAARRGWTRPQRLFQALTGMREVQFSARDEAVSIWTNETPLVGDAHRTRADAGSAGDDDAAVLRLSRIVRRGGSVLPSAGRAARRPRAGDE